MSVLAPLAPYRRVLALPRVRSLVLVTLLARIPVGAASVALTLHVVLSLGGGFGAAGALGAAMTVGTALGAPLTGRMTDRHGLRRTLLVTTLAQGAFWLIAPSLPYLVLVPAAFFGGLLSLPLFSVSRQSLAALVPEDRRRTAYSLDSMAVEVSFMVGPAAGVLLATQLSTKVALLAMGGSMMLSGLLLYVLDPPVRSDAELREAEGQAPVPRRQWITGRLVVILMASAGATLVLSGTDIGIVATLRHAGELKWSGLVIAIWCCWSLAGGFVHGSLPRSLPALALMELLCVLTIPVGLAGDWWSLALALIPAGAMCAPTIAATGEVISRLAPAAVRGEAMGLHGSALTAGLALGAPLVGVVVDRWSPTMGFAVAGASGALLGVIGLALGTMRRRVAGAQVAAR
ncbi:MAG TPA: MFS transporter [Candidatus Dormibacteraeota bacterium]|nr:MFS transporter [Candidatus Dormibacteraeota bacterium]